MSELRHDFDIRPDRAIVFAATPGFHPGSAGARRRDLGDVRGPPESPREPPPPSDLRPREAPGHGAAVPARELRGALGELVQALAEELNVRVKSGWSTTFRREDLRRGLEPDRCFYVQNVAAVLGRLEIDLTRDPPPDLAVEVHITRSSLDRTGIYAALGIPEVWRFDGKRFGVWAGRDAAGYEPRDVGPAFRSLPTAVVAALRHKVVGLDDLTQARRLRAWVRERALPGNQSSPS